MSTPGDQPDPITPEAAERIRELQVLITDSQRKADKAEDEDIREALNLQASALGLKVSRLRKGLPEDLPPAVEEASEEELEPLPQCTPEQLYEADMLIQRAMLEKRRGNKQGASDLLKKATEAAPGAAVVLEAVGDDYADRKQFAAAKDAYKAAHRADPTIPSIERKLAQLAMTGMAEMSIEDRLRMGSFDSPFIQQGEAMANPKIALVLNIFAPGLGQFAMGRQKKAIAIFSVFFLSLILFVALSYLLLPPPPLDAKGHALPRPADQRLPTWAYFPIVVAVATWLVGIADATTTMKSSGGPPANKPSKPVPPVNLPFE